MQGMTGSQPKLLSSVVFHTCIATRGPDLNRLAFRQDAQRRAVIVKQYEIPHLPVFLTLKHSETVSKYVISDFHNRGVCGEAQPARYQAIKAPENRPVCLCSSLGVKNTD
jgi:hypothetical protein